LIFREEEEFLDENDDDLQTPLDGTLTVRREEGRRGRHSR